MSLNYNTANVSKETLEKQAENECFNVCFSLMVIGVSRIDEKSLPTIRKRLAGYARAFGPLLKLNDEEAHALFARWSGLTTNVAPVTDARFASDLAKQVRAEIVKAMKDAA